MHRTTADALTLTIVIGNPAEQAEAKKQLLVCIQAVYQIIGCPVPAALPAYIEKEEHFLAHEPYGVASLFTTTQAIWFRMGRNP